MTPMQDLRDFIVSLVNHGASDDLLAVIIAIDKRFLQKEKDDIKKAHINGQSEFDMLQYRDINRTLSDNYYNQTYGE
jgi:hypothetical protein